MGWANCGVDSRGRQIGYSHPAVCDHPGCTAEIDRGLSYACGDMHGDTEYGCDLYFCEEHLFYTEVAEGRVEPLCAECAKGLEDA